MDVSKKIAKAAMKSLKPKMKPGRFNLHVDAQTNKTDCFESRGKGERTYE